MSARHNPEIQLYLNGTKSQLKHSNFRVRKSSSKEKCYYANENNTFQIFKSCRQENRGQKFQRWMVSSKRCINFDIHKTMYTVVIVWMKLLEPSTVWFVQHRNIDEITVEILKSDKGHLILDSLTRRGDKSSISYGFQLSDIWSIQIVHFYRLDLDYRKMRLWTPQNIENLPKAYLAQLYQWYQKIKALWSKWRNHGRNDHWRWKS